MLPLSQMTSGSSPEDDGGDTIQGIQLAGLQRDSKLQ